jgi:hypothetical protein
LPPILQKAVGRRLASTSARLKPTNYAATNITAGKGTKQLNTWIDSRAAGWLGVSFRFRRNRALQPLLPCNEIGWKPQQGEMMPSQIQICGIPMMQTLLLALIGAVVFADMSYRIWFLTR